MRTYDITLDGVKESRLTIDHKFLLILSDQGFPVDLSVLKGAGFEEVKGVQAGFGVRLTDQTRGKEFIFNSATAQTIKVFVGDDEAIYNRLSGTVTLNGGTISGIDNTVKQVSDGQVYGASYRSTTLLAANTPDVVFTAAANANGAIIHSAQFVEVINAAPYGANGAFLAKNAAPANVTDGDAILSGDNVTTGASWQSVGGSLKNPLRIPAGKGLFYISSQAQNTFTSRSVLYTLL